MESCSCEESAVPVSPRLEPKLASESIVKNVSARQQSEMGREDTSEIAVNVNRSCQQTQLAGSRGET